MFHSCSSPYMVAHQLWFCNVGSPKWPIYGYIGPIYSKLKFLGSNMVRLIKLFCFFITGNHVDVHNKFVVFDVCGSASTLTSKFLVEKRSNYVFLESSKTKDNWFSDTLTRNKRFLRFYARPTGDRNNEPPRRVARREIKSKDPDSPIEIEFINIWRPCLTKKELEARLRRYLALVILIATTSI